MITVALISCSASKLHQPASAQELYTGTLFRYARTWVETNGWRWHVLSARHGLVDPFCVVEPYDQRLRGSAPESWVKDVWQALLGRYAGQSVQFKILAGRTYRDRLIRRIEATPGWSVDVPLAGLGIGQQIAWLKKRTE